MTSTNILDRFRLDDRVAVVTGASSGLGVAFAHALASAGAHVVLGARRADRLADTAAALAVHGRKVTTVQMDVTQPEDCERLAAEAAAAHGQIDILVNNAGIGIAVPALKEHPDQFRGVMDVNLFGAYWMAKACGQHMKPGSSVVNISSVLGLVSLGLPQAAYATSKGALIALTRDLAQQWTGRKGIRVNALAPGFFPSEMTEEYDNWDVVMPLIPAGRLGEVEEVAAAAVFLASDAASYISGTVLAVDGGLLTW